MKLKDEVQRRNLFEKGTPCIYNDGKKEIAGEVVINKRGLQAIAPYYIDKRGGTQNYNVVPETWFNVREFNSAERKFIKIYKHKGALEKHINKLIARNVPYSINSNKLNYWF